MKIDSLKETDGLPIQAYHAENIADKSVAVVRCPANLPDLLRWENIDFVLIQKLRTGGGRIIKSFKTNIVTYCTELETLTD